MPIEPIVIPFTVRASGHVGHLRDGDRGSDERQYGGVRVTSRARVFQRVVASGSGSHWCRGYENNETVAVGAAFAWRWWGAAPPRGRRLLDTTLWPSCFARGCARCARLDRPNRQRKIRRSAGSACSAALSEHGWWRTPLRQRERDEDERCLVGLPQRVVYRGTKIAPRASIGPPAYSVVPDGDDKVVQMRLGRCA